MPAVRQPPSATSTYSTGVIPLSCAANCSGWSMSKANVLLCVCSSPKPKKVWTSERLWVPLTHDTVERHWNWAACGASANTSRAPSRASTFTPLSTSDVVMVQSLLVTGQEFAVSGPNSAATVTTTSAGKPPRRACSRTVSTSSVSCRQ